LQLDAKGEPADVAMTFETATFTESSDTTSQVRFTPSQKG
jgi:hypothetical protein